MFTDAHVHPYDLFTASGREPAPVSEILLPGSRLCASSHAKEEFLWNEAFALRFTTESSIGVAGGDDEQGAVILSFAVHPQNPDPECLSFLEDLAQSGRIDAVGETGFDFFNAGFKAGLERQRVVWAEQVRIAAKYGLPLVVHCRKALDLIFTDSRKLADLPAVIFHGWPGSPAEAKALLKRGVNAWFSAGKGLLRGDRSLIATVEHIERNRILAETDAPWMTLRGEPYTRFDDIVPVHEKIGVVWNMPLEETAALIAENFKCAFGIRQ